MRGRTRHGCPEVCGPQGSRASLRVSEEHGNRGWTHILAGVCLGVCVGPLVLILGALSPQMPNKWMAFESKSPGPRPCSGERSSRWRPGLRAAPAGTVQHGAQGVVSLERVYDGETGDEPEMYVLQKQQSSWTAVSVTLGALSHKRRKSPGSGVRTVLGTESDGTQDGATFPRVKTVQDAIRKSVAMLPLGTIDGGEVLGMRK